MNYLLNPEFDTTLAIVFTLGTINPDSVLNGLVYQAVKVGGTTPDAVAGKYIVGAIVQNATTGVVYRNSGTTASPSWTAM